MLRVFAFVTGVVIGVGLILTLVAGLSRAVPMPPVASAQAQATTSQGAGEVLTHPVDPRDDAMTGDDDDNATQVDLQGDEVTAAVARYRFDAQGNIYETHAPHTEVPRLGPPQL